MRRVSVLAGRGMRVWEWGKRDVMVFLGCSRGDTKRARTGRAIERLDVDTLHLDEGTVGVALVIETHKAKATGLLPHRVGHDLQRMRVNLS